MKHINLKGPWMIILVAFLLVAIILIFGYQSFKATEKAAFDEFNQRQLVLAKEATRGIELYFENLAGDMRALARLPEMQHFDEVPARREIQYMLLELEPWGVNDIGVLDADGVLRYNAVAPQIEGTDFSWRKYYQEAREMTANDTYIIEFIEFKGVEAGQKGVLVAVPMFEIATDENYPAPSGQFAGVVVCTLKLDTVTERFIAPIQSSEQGHSFLIDDEHNILWTIDRSFFGKNLLTESTGFPAFQQVVEKMSTGASGTAEYSFYKFEDSTDEYIRNTEEEKLIAYAPIRLGNELWSIGVWAPKEDARQLIWSAYLSQSFVVGLSVLIILLGSAYALGTSSRVSKFLEKEIEAKVGELRESEDRYRRLVELSPDTIAIQSEDRVVFMNGAGAKLFGVESPEQLIGKSIWDFIPPENRGDVQERHQQRRGKDIKMPPVEQKFIRPDGTTVDIEVTATPFVYKGKPAIQAIFRNITERKQAEEALTAAYEFQQSIIDGVGDPIMVIGADYQIKLMNRAAREFSGGDIDVSNPVFCYQVSHQRQAPCEGLQHPCPMEQVRESGKPVTVIHQHHQADGEPRFVEVVASPLWGADGAFQGIIEAVRDITDRKPAEEALAQQAQALSQSDDELEQFAFKVVKSLQDFFGKLPPD